MNKTTENSEEQENLNSLESKKCCKSITVEPTLVLYMLAFMLTAVVENVFFVYKSCTVNHGYSHEICMELEKHNETKAEVQRTTSTFLQWNSIAGHVIPIILAFFLGSFSDRRGRLVK
jgi:PCFT/HCP family folate transporter-like MFS transporter 1/3